MDRNPHPTTRRLILIVDLHDDVSPEQFDELARSLQTHMISLSEEELEDEMGARLVAHDIVPPLPSMSIFPDGEFPDDFFSGPCSCPGCKELDSADDSTFAEIIEVNFGSAE